MSKKDNMLHSIGVIAFTVLSTTILINDLINKKKKNDEFSKIWWERNEIATGFYDRIVNDYRITHPDTKLSYSEIVENYLKTHIKQTKP